MKTPRRALPVVLLLLVLLLGVGGSSVVALGQVAPAGAVVRETLPNGLQVIIVPDPLVPVVTTNMNYLAGANEAGDLFPGMAHAEEHMMFRGSPGLTGDQLTPISVS